MTTLTTVFLGTSLLMGSSEKIDVPKGTPKCIKKKIRQENDKCLYKVYEYTYQGKIVFLFVPANCPDALYDFYNENCDLICSPSGGISSNCDGKCTDFYHQTTNEKLIWSK
jgi:hypothetical protein